MKPFYLLLVIASVILYSCNSKTEGKTTAPVEKPVQQAISLSGMAYLFAPAFDAKECEAVGNCDCCTSVVLFIDSKNFITICPCESEESVLRGTYSIIKGKVVLSYDTLRVDRDYNWEADVDTTQTSKPEFSITLNKAKASIETLTPKYCNGKLYFEAGTNEEKSFGTIDSRYSLKEYIKMLKEEGIWEQIQQ